MNAREAEHLQLLTVRVDQGQLGRRFLQDALSEATAAHWRRRAAAMESARPRSGDYSGRATPAQLAEADQRCASAAEACRRRADALERGLLDPFDPDELAELFGAVAAEWRVVA